MRTLDKIRFLLKHNGDNSAKGVKSLRQIAGNVHRFDPRHKSDFGRSFSQGSLNRRR